MDPTEDYSSPRYHNQYDIDKNPIMWSARFAQIGEAYRQDTERLWSSSSTKPRYVSYSGSSHNSNSDSGSILPVPEGILLGVVIGLAVSSKNGILGFALHWSTISGIAIGLIAMFCWVAIYNVPILGSLISIAASSVYATILWKNSGSIYLGIAAYAISVAVHYGSLDEERPSRVFGWRPKKLEALILLAGTITLLACFSVYYAHSKGLHALRALM